MTQLSGVAGDGLLFNRPPPPPTPRVLYYRLNSRGMLGRTKKQPDYRSVFNFLTSSCGKSTTDQLASFLFSFALKKYI